MQHFDVDYYATTPSGTRSRFHIISSVYNLIGMAHSETAVLSYLKQRHPGCDITIVNLEFTE